MFMTIMENNSFCVNPYLNFSIHPSGHIKPCCMSQKEFVTDNGAKTLDQESVINFWNSQDRKKMISDLGSGKKIDECKFCWDEEAAGKESKRIRDNKIYKDRILSSEMMPVVGDFSLGNTCNLKCRICSPIHSSLWMAEEANLKFDNPNDYLKNKKWTITKNSFNSSNEKFWNDIYLLLNNIERLDFAGGEPFYIDKHWDIIKYCVDTGISKNQYVHYNTNGTIFPDKYIDLLKHFKTVDIQFSVDGIGKKFEYLRHPAQWDILEKNIEKFIEFKNQNNVDIRYNICFSVSAFNVYDFYEVYNYYKIKNLGIYVNYVHDHRSALILPLEIRQKIIDYLDSIQCDDEKWILEKTICINYLKYQKYNSKDFVNFWRDVNQRDQYRKESFKNTFPELYKLIQTYI